MQYIDNRDLFNFEFIDREEQTQRLIEYLSGNEAQKPIWIYGPSGAGKTRFLKQAKKHINQSTIVYVELFSNERNINGSKILISELEKATRYSIKKFIKNNYSHIADSIKNILSIALNLIFKVNTEKLLDIVFEPTKTYITKKKEQHSATELLIGYIKKISQKNKLIIIIDNFMNCDNISTDIIIDVINSIRESFYNKVNFILVTTEEDGEHSETAKKILKKLPVYSIPIFPFNNYEYFMNILFYSVDINKTGKRTISLIFEYCCGNPQKLNDFIHKLDSKCGVIYNIETMKYYFKKEVVEDIIFNSTVEYNLDTDFNFFEKLIIALIVCLRKSISENLLLSIIEFIGSSNNLFFIDQDDFRKSLINLVYKRSILGIEQIKQKSFIKIEHDLKLNNFKIQLENDHSGLVPLLYNYLFKYFTINRNILVSDEMNEDDFNDLYAFYAYKSLVPDWIHINYSDGIRKNKKKLYSESVEVLDRIISDLTLFTSDELLNISNCYYDSGNYKSAREIIKYIDLEKKDNNFLFDLYMLKSKIEDLSMQLDKSLEYLDEALKYCVNSTEKQFRILNSKQQIMVDIATKRNQSKDLFDYLKNNYSANSTTLYGKMLKSSIDFYRGEIAQQDLNLAEQIAIQQNNQLELGYIYTNRGFDFFWQLEIDKAIDCFEEAIKKLRVLKIHEIAYALNNLANCYMILGNYSEALSALQNAVLWNESYYVDLTIKNNLMVCYALMEQTQPCMQIIFDLEKKINTVPDDISLPLKISYNLGVAYEHMGNPDKAVFYKNRAFSIADQSKDMFLPYTWMKDYDINIEKDILKRVKPGQENFLKNRFEPFLVTISHD